MSDEFYRSMRGARFFDHTMPELVRQIGRLADSVTNRQIKQAGEFDLAELELLRDCVLFTGGGLSKSPADDWSGLPDLKRKLFNIIQEVKDAEK